MIYFVRHGESEANKRGVFAGQKEDSPLTSKGREQAVLTAQAIIVDKVKMHRVISSPLKRSLETAQIISQELKIKHTKVVVDERITEYDMGSLTGTPIHKISSALLTRANGAEDVHSFLNRVVECIRDLGKIDRNSLVVSHAGVGRILETIKQNIDPVKFYDLPPYANASVTIIDWVG